MISGRSFRPKQLRDHQPEIKDGLLPQPMLGYIAYALICAFGALQLITMVSAQNRNFGQFPAAVLVAGLALLQVAVMRDGAPYYIQIGNFISLFFTSCCLWVAITEAREERFRNTRYLLTPKGYAETEDLIDRGRGDN